MLFHEGKACVNRFSDCFHRFRRNYRRSTYRIGFRRCNTVTREISSNHVKVARCLTEGWGIKSSRFDVSHDPCALTLLPENSLRLGNNVLHLLLTLLQVAFDFVNVGVVD